MKRSPRKMLDKASDHLGKIAGIISAVIVIVGAVTGAVSWLNGQVQAVISAQISDLKSEVQNNQQKTEVQITRLELLNLIHNQPKNAAEIEKVAKRYFQELDGDWYATNLYSAWCQEYGGDPSIAVGGK